MDVRKVVWSYGLQLLRISTEGKTDDVEGGIEEDMRERRG